MKVQAVGGADPGDGWAFVAIDQTVSPTDFAAASYPLGVPTDRDGFAVEWFLGTPSEPEDRARIRALQATGADTVVVQAPPGMGRVDADTSSGAGNQYVAVTVRPDLPWTAGDETSIEVRDGFVGDFVTGCGPYPGAPTSVPACGFTITPGGLVFGLPASSASRTAIIETRERTTLGGTTTPPRRCRSRSAEADPLTVNLDQSGRKALGGGQDRDVHVHSFGTAHIASRVLPELRP